MDIIAQALDAFGLTESERKIYLSLLKFQEQTAWDLARNVRLHRSSTYNILEKLISKGVVGSITKEGVGRYVACRPLQILQIFREKETAILKAIPQLESLQLNSHDAVEVELFKGTEGIKTFMRQLVSEAKKFQLFGTLRFEELMPMYIENLMITINEKNIHEYAILESGTKMIAAKNNHYRYVGAEYLFPNAIIIFNDVVGIFVWDQPLHVIKIKSKTTSDSYKAHFNLLWKIGRQVKTSSITK